MWRQVLLVALQWQRGGGQDSGCCLGRVKGTGGGAAGQTHAAAAEGWGRGQALPTGREVARKRGDLLQIGDLR